ncbi:PD-(D/E)XK nuclease-like domain-containing protein [Streptomyces lydicus]|uniref:PD-(D/E)XK nuclease-like domain-containing protein n=1 Tax=Streptomyces lydicus TaxID=47763 RepID=UPI001010DF29|nr:PD-(D/E)XK nuclease-like domain-containing protein [Streptomyces lydicus]MCZ1006380.1 PD-(D/E)XK nuclease-like domain-containing protein [Streptomyces lydicus]
MTTTEQPQVTGPGIYDLTAEQYHRDPVEGGSLSSSGARRLLPPSCPALFRWEQDHPQPPKKTFDFGHAAHKEVLGVGPELVLVDAARWDSDAIKAEVASIRAAGGVPLKRPEFEQVQAMAAAIRRHPVASWLFEPETGTAESALVWRDGPTGIMRRALLDWRPDPGPGRMIIRDYKTARSADPATVARAVHEYGYHQQADWYRAGCRALGLCDETAEFVFVVQEKDPPYLVTVVQPDGMAMRIGAARNRRAIETYARCVETGHWPGYADEPVYLSLPPWAEIRDSEEYL